MIRHACLPALALLASAALGQDRPPDHGMPRGGPYVHRICSASSDDGLAWTRDEGTRLDHASVPCALVADGKGWTLVGAPAVPGADPGAVAAKDGGWIVVTTGSPRPGTPGARRRK